MKKPPAQSKDKFYNRIRQIIEDARDSVARVVNIEMVQHNSAHVARRIMIGLKNVTQCVTN